MSAVVINIPEALPAGAFSPAKNGIAATKLNMSMTPMSEASTAPPFSPLAGFEVENLLESRFGRMLSDPEDLLELLAPAYVDICQPGEEKEYYLDNSQLRAGTKGMAFRVSKNVGHREHGLAGPSWGTTIYGRDEGDGWVSVGEYYLPMLLEGTPVLRDAAAIAAWDGPALTDDGCAMDLDGGTSIFFSHAKEHSFGNSVKQEAMEAAQQLRAVKFAHAACEAEARLLNDEIASVDIEGVVRGAIALTMLSWSDGMLERARRKLRHQRKVFSSAANCGCDGEKSIVCATEGGKVFLYLHLSDRNAGRAQRIRRAIVQEDVQGLVAIVDSQGVLQGCRKRNAVPPVVPAYA